tara:strand:+ start:8922 stop:9257 length:336 start_codon:yes stop_codon:yes gene_type:complete
MTITIYHNPRCSKSRQAVQFLQEQNIPFQTHLYLEEPMPKEVLKKALETLGDAIIRTGEADYKTHIKGQNLSTDALVEAMLAHPKTIERPLLTHGDKMAVARPLENIQGIL